MNPPDEISTLDLHLISIAAHLQDPSVTELIINRPGELILERSSGIQVLQIPELTYRWCDDLTKLLSGRASQGLDEGWPLLGATLPAGLRVQVVIPPATTPGVISITIRRPISEVLTLNQLIDGGIFCNVRCEQSARLSGAERDELERTLPDGERELLARFRAREWGNFLPEAVRARKNIISSGRTGSGKTTLGNALAAAIPTHERIITIEDVAETRLPQHRAVHLFYPKGENGLSRLQPKDLLEAALRMRPDRVLLAELRGNETFFFIQNVLNSGHPGTITSVHATRAKLVFQRLGLMIKGSPEGAGLDLTDIMDTLYSLVDIVVQMDRDVDGRRFVREVYYDPAYAALQLG